MGNVRGLGMMAAVELVADKASKEPFPTAANVGARVLQELTRRGLYTRVVGDTICIAPPLITPVETIDRIVRSIRSRPVG